jgi:hypothetical protein
MKKTILLLTTALLLTAGWAMAQTASLSFNDNGLGGGTATDGTYLPTSTFNFDVFMTYSGGTAAQGLSYWLETENGVAPNITNTAQTYFTFTIAQDGEAKPWTFTDTSGADAGFKTDQSATQSGDFGATITSGFPGPGTFQVSNLVFSLAGAAPGTYHLELCLLSTNTPKASEATVDFNDVFFTTRTTYTFTVVPEPATWSLLGLGGLGSMGLIWLRARKRS